MSELLLGPIRDNKTLVRQLGKGTKVYLLRCEAEREHVVVKIIVKRKVQRAKFKPGA